MPAVSAELPAGRAQAAGRSSTMGLPFTHEHRGAVRAAAGGLGGAEDGSLSPHLRAGNHLSFIHINGALTMQHFYGLKTNKKQSS